MATKSTTKKGPAGPETTGARAARRGTKAGSKASMERLRRQFDELNYRSALPFAVHEGGVLGPQDLPRDFDFGQYEWSNRECRVAQAALRSRFSLAVPVPSAGIAQAASAIARTLKSPALCMGYDNRNQKLILWDVSYEEGEEDDDDGTP